VYTARKISANLSDVTVKGDGKLERAMGYQDGLCAVAFPPSLFLSWLATDVCICNGERSSELCCDKETDGSFIKGRHVYIHAHSAPSKKFATRINFKGL
jgi:hypothetical protein